jgi:hypothetical protein
MVIAPACRRWAVEKAGDLPLTTYQLPLNTVRNISRTSTLRNFVWMPSTIDKYTDLTLATGTKNRARPLVPLVGPRCVLRSSDVVSKSQMINRSIIFSNELITFAPYPRNCAFYYSRRSICPRSSTIYPQ